MAAKPKEEKTAQELLKAQRSRENAQQWAVKTAGLFVLAVFVLHPLFMGSSLYFAITGAKQAFFLALAAVLFVLLFFYSVTVPGFYSRMDWRGLWKSLRPYEWVLLAYVLVMAVSTVFADNIGDAIGGYSARNEGLAMMLVYFGVAAAVGRLCRPKDWMLYALCGTAALVAVYGVCQYYGADFLGLYTDYLVGTQTGNSQTFFSTMSNRNVSSTYLCLGLCVSFVMFSRMEKRLHWLFLPLGLAIFYGLLVGRTESGYVGLALSMAVAFPFIVSSWRAAARFFLMGAGCLGVMWVATTVALTDPIFASYWAFARPYLLPAAAAALAAAGVLCLIKLPPVPLRIRCALWYILLAVIVVVFLSFLPQLAEATGNISVDELNSIMQGNLDDSFMSGRMAVWKRAATMIPDRLLLGHGPDNFSYSFGQAFGEEIVGQKFDKAHNEYLQTLFDNGVLGLLCLLGFYGSLIFAARKKLTPMALAVITAMLCHMGQAFFNFVSPFAHPVAWTLWGFLAALLYESAGEDAGAKAPSPGDAEK